jgi:hypothetical protein
MSSWKLNQIKPVWPTGPADPFRSFDLKARIADQPCSWNPLAAVGAAWGLPGFANVPQGSLKAGISYKSVINQLDVDDVE